MRRKLVLKALTDPKFRQLLQDSPDTALSSDEKAAVKGGANEILDFVYQINEQSEKVSDLIFCMIKDDDDDIVYA